MAAIAIRAERHHSCGRHVSGADQRIRCFGYRLPKEWGRARAGPTGDLSFPQATCPFLHEVPPRLGA